MTPRVVTAGETMALIVPTAPGRLRHATTLSLSIGGAESNLAIGLARLGVATSWVSGLGDDELGELVLHRLRAEGVDTSAVRRVPDRPTGIYLRDEVAGALRVHYYRRGSAAATLAPGDLPAALLQGAAFLHLTGITGALSPECAEFLPWAARTAREAGVRVSYDVNYRSRLWSPEAARAATEALLPLVDVLFVGHDEAAALWGSDRSDADASTPHSVRSGRPTPDQGDRPDADAPDQAGPWLDRLAAAGPREVVVKLGADGCVARIDGVDHRAPAHPAREVDPIGAGDAFDAGYLAATLWGRPPDERLRTANAMGAFCVQTPGDYEGLPSARELAAFLDQTTDLGR